MKKRREAYNLNDISLSVILDVIAALTLILNIKFTQIHLEFPLYISQEGIHQAFRILPTTNLFKQIKDELS